MDLVEIRGKGILTSVLVGMWLREKGREECLTTIDGVKNGGH